MAELDFSKVNYETYSDEKRQEIQQSVLDARKDLQDAQLTIETMRKRQRMLFRNLKHYTAALAPHKQLPDDVLREIFIWCARASGRTRIDLIKNHTPQLVLSHSRSDSQRTLDIAEAWLKRAGKFPVYLELYVSSYCTADRTTIFKKLCSNAQIECFDWDLRINELNELPDDLPQRIKEVRLRTDLFAEAKPPRLP
ncbi:hypothetical protein AX17_004815, partial [Amanita inopinata Kibby_2008]